MKGIARFLLILAVGTGLPVWARSRRLLRLFQEIPILKSSPN